MPLPDVCIAGAGIIGLALARSLALAGLHVLVLTRAQPLDEASQAAAGMLAVHDPDNPPALLPLSSLSRSLYPAFLASLAADSGHPLRFQTHRTLQLTEPTALHHQRILLPTDLHTLLPTLAPTSLTALDLDEVSLDPRELASALLASLPAHPRIRLRTRTPITRVVATPTGVTLHTPKEHLQAAAFVDCTGAWSLSSSILPSLRIAPRKGQMLTLLTPPALARNALVLRSPKLYLVPRLHGPRAGHCILGATIEDAGFDRTVHPQALQHLLAEAAHLLPELADVPILSSWAGLRPATADLLPILGRLNPPLTAPDSLPLFIASGHFRNGILLAPATASLLASLILGNPPAPQLHAFSPARFQHQTSP